MKYIILILLCFTIQDLYAQHSAKSHRAQQQLQIGDKVPDLLITKFMNKSHAQLHLSDLYKKGGLIINFWATWCSPCLVELPVLNGLAGKYKSKLGVLSVEYEEPQLVAKFLSSHRDIKISDLNMIAGDTLLVEYLKHRSLPSNVWIDSTGTIKYITHGDEINESNIINFTKGIKLRVTNAVDKTNFSFTAPFHYQDSSFIYRSILTKETPGIPSGYNFISKSVSSTNWQISRIYVFNLSISQLYAIAYSKMVASTFVFDYFNRIEFQTKDSIKYFQPKSDSALTRNSKYLTRAEWAVDNSYCYDLTLPLATSAETAFDKMFEDLQRAFHLNVKIKKELRPCTVIRLADESKLNIFLQSKKDTSLIRKTAKGLYTQNNKIGYLFENLNSNLRLNLREIPTDPPYINETGIDYPIDLSIEYSKSNPTYTEVKSQIEKKYGLSFHVEQRLVPILVISDSSL